MRGNVHCIPGNQGPPLGFSLKSQYRRPREQNNPFGVLLIVPLPFPRGLTGGYNPLYPTRLAPQEFLELLIIRQTFKGCEQVGDVRDHGGALLEWKASGAELDSTLRKPGCHNNRGRRAMFQEPAPLIILKQ
ncbi:hypothetical protein [Gimesia sp.]|uniref:hypothetical protein n=1 Tax=Gimesia sp. TaxID=2024833 RepID=UPI003A8E820B